MECKELILFGVIIVFLLVANMLRKWSLFAPLVFFVSLLADNLLVQLGGMIAFVALVILDAKRKGKESVFSKYNVYSKDCVLPKRAIIIITLIGAAVSVLALIGILLGKKME